MEEAGQAERRVARRVQETKYTGWSSRVLRQAATSFTPIQPPRTLKSAVFKFTSSLSSPPLAVLLLPSVGSTSKSQHNGGRPVTRDMRVFSFSLTAACSK